MKTRLLILAILFLIGQPLRAAVDMFLKLEGVPGESLDDKHKDEIEIESFSWGLSDEGATGKATFQDFHFTKFLDKASPLLMLKCANGVHIKEATITVRKAGEKPVEYLVIKLSDVLVSSYQNAGSSAGTVPTDQFSLNYTKIEYKYYPQLPDGTRGDPITTIWDLKPIAPQ